MTEVLDKLRPATYYGGKPVSPYEDEFVSPTAVPPEPPEPPSKDDSADAGGPRWRVEKEKERHFTIWIAEDFSTHPDASSDLEQIDKTRKESLSEALQTAVPNVLDNSKLRTALIVLPQETGHSSGTFAVSFDAGTFAVSFDAGAFAVSFDAGTFAASLDAALFENATEKDVPAPLADALHDLREINDEAAEEGIAPPSALAIANADRLLRAIYGISPRQYLVELLPEGVIAIAIPGGFRSSVALLCESDGGALCSVNMNGKHRRQRYPHTYQLPDRFIREALSELGRE